MSCRGCGSGTPHAGNPRPARRRKTKGFFSEQGELDRNKSETFESPRTPCQCEIEDGQGHIYCERHKCIKTESLCHLCQFRQDYFDLWERGAGPMQSLLPEKSEKIEEAEEIEPQKHHEETFEQRFFMGDPDIPLKSRGLGDTVAKITKVTGIKAIVDKINDALGRECKCKERQSKLNKLVPYEKPKKTKGFFE